MGTFDGFVEAKSNIHRLDSYLYVVRNPRVGGTYELLHPG